LAAPRIEVDNTTFHAGTVAENSAVEAVFTVRNAGTETLRITNVRPDCGCTVAGYDSVIAPGRSGTIKSRVDLRGMRAGRMARGVNVMSNAANSPTLKLTIEAHIAAPVGLSESFLVIEGPNPHALYITSAKTDLMVTNVLFKPLQQQRVDIGDWASSIPLDLGHTFTATDSTLAGGLRVYRLDITPPANGSPMTGTFQISTNHPDRREVIINGRMNR
jgi:hypothetical protein